MLERTARVANLLVDEVNRPNRTKCFAGIKRPPGGNSVTGRVRVLTSGRSRSMWGTEAARHAKPLSAQAAIFFRRELQSAGIRSVSATPRARPLPRRGLAGIRYLGGSILDPGQDRRAYFHAKNKAKLLAYLAKRRGVAP